jgi:hypothetical protein
MSEEKIDGAKSADTSINKEQIISEFLESKDFEKKIQGIKGDAVRTALEKYEAETLPKKQEEWQSAFEKSKELTAEQRTIKALEEKVAAMELADKQEKKQRLFAENKAHALSALTEKGLKVPESILDRFVSDEKEKTEQGLKEFADFMTNYTTELKSQSVKSNNVQVPGNKTAGGGGLTMPGENATQAELEAYYKAKRAAERKN